VLSTLTCCRGRNVKDSHLGHSNTNNKCISMGYWTGSDGVGSAGFNGLLDNMMLQWPIVIFGKTKESCSTMLGWMSLVPNVDCGNGLEGNCVCFKGSQGQGGS